jgi:predicted nucleic acid-binding protein
MPESAAEVYGSIRAELEVRGEMIGNNDLARAKRIPCKVIQ